MVSKYGSLFFPETWARRVTAASRIHVHLPVIDRKGIKRDVDGDDVRDTGRYIQEEQRKETGEREREIREREGK